MYGLATADFFRRGRPPPADRIAPPPPQRQRLQDPPPLAPAPARHPAAAIDRDPETRLPINSFGPGERDAVRRAYIQRGVFVPPPTSADGKYPLVERSGSSERGVRVQAAWFQRFKWLELSASMDMLFCLPCYLFPPTGHLAKSAFVKDGFQSFKKVGGKDCALLRHEGSSPNSAHNVAVCKMTDLMNEDANIVTGIAGFNQANERERTENRTRLNGSIRALRYLMRQGLACRGHDESTESLNRGNFLELLNTLCERDEELARVSMGNAPQNATMTSPDIQKDIITAHAALVRAKLDEEQGDVCYCIMADETRDESKKEQMVLVNRFVDKATGILRERFVGMFHVTDTTAATLFDTIVKAQVNRTRPIARCRGQSYDGASTMSGEISGLQKRIRDVEKHAYFIHCWAHCLQLALVAACRDGLVDVAVFFTMVSDIINVASGSAKRNDILLAAQKDLVDTLIEELQKSTGRGLNQATALARPGNTRWASLWKALVRLIEMFAATVTVIEGVETTGSSSDQRAEAKRLLDGMFTFKFVFILHMMEELLGITHEVSQSMQVKDQDIVNAMRLVEVALEQLQKVRDNGYEKLLERVKEFCRQQDIPVLDMDAVFVRVGRPRRNALTDTNDHVFRVDLFYAAVDKMIAEIGLRFSPETTAMLRLASCISPRRQFEAFNVDQLVELVTTYYTNDFDSIDLRQLPNQLHNFHVELENDARLRDIKTLPALSVLLVQSGRAAAGYDLVYRLVGLILTLPVSSATAERIFSALRFIKNRLRTTMGQEFLNDAMLLYVEKELAATVTNDEIIVEFQKMKERRRRV
jgi:hypothetical protein